MRESVIDTIDALTASDPDRQHMARFLEAHAFHPFNSPETFEDYISFSSSFVKILPLEMIQGLLSFRRASAGQGVLLLRNLPVDDRKIGPTPVSWQQTAQTKQSFETEMCLLGVTSLLGEVFSFHTQHEGNLIQNVVPLAADRYEQVGTGSAVFLEWHTEDAFHDCAADFIALLCLRADPAAATTFASVRQMQISDADKHILFEKRFYAGIDKAHGGTGRPADGVLIPIFFGDYHAPFLRVDTSCIQAQDRAADLALQHLIQEMHRVAHDVVLKQGDLLILDNHVVVHGRTPFTPRFDGTDRWLQRVSITANFRKFSGIEMLRPRVIKMVVQSAQSN